MSTDTATRPPIRKVPGEDGIWVFVIGDMAVFALFFGVVVYTRGHAPAAFAQGQATLARSLGALNTALLLTSSLLVATGVRGARRSATPRRALPFPAALSCGVGFLVVKGIEWGRELAHGHTLSTGDFYQYYFMLTGIHLLHVLIGIIVLARLTLVSGRPVLEPRDLTLIETGATFWHMVDLLWVVLFALFYLMPSGAP